MDSRDDGKHSNAALTLLNVYYPVVSTLQTYLHDILDSKALHVQIVGDDDTSHYQTLLETSYVATRVPPADLKRFVPTPPMSHMQDVIDRAQEKLFFKARNGKPSNIITAGYRKVNQRDARGKIGASRVPLTNYFVNTMVTALQAQEWETLLQRIGEDAMFHLLTETSIFASLPNGCLCQMTGDPVLHMKPPVSAPRRSSEGDLEPEGRTSCLRGTKRRCVVGYCEERPSKRRKHAHTTNVEGRKLLRIEDPNRVAPADVAFQRSRMFYSRPSFVPHTAKIITGLPPKHVLNRFHSAWHSSTHPTSAVWVDPEPRQQMEHARHLAKYVFPRQYELSNAFISGSSGKYGSFRMVDYVDREQEIKSKGSCKTPKRLKHVLGILEKMVWRHHKCKYKMLLDMACPSKVIGSTYVVQGFLGVYRLG
ncbi:hypothetical protein LXA43DRAFT_491424 [Ganoderma leucocontextum]|nr:hypothetical protein LXA43DRAFT_491424 [Ganoderma leucocontextum]